MADLLQNLMQDHGPLVRGMCMRLTDDPEDAAQEIWEKVTRALSSFDVERATPARSWIVTIARRHLVDRHRRRLVRGRAVDPSGLVDPGRSPEDHLSLKSRRIRLEAAIQKLPSAQRHVVVMHHIHGVDLETLADEAGVPLGTIKSRLHRGRAGLAALLRRT